MLSGLLSTSVGLPSATGTLAREARVLQVASGQREQRRGAEEASSPQDVVGEAVREKIKESCLETQTDAQIKKREREA